MVGPPSPALRHYEYKYRAVQARPVPTMVAAGVAKPSAQGQEISSTAMALASAMRNASPSQPSAKGTPDSMMTDGTNTDDKASTVF